MNSSRATIIVIVVVESQIGQKVKGIRHLALAKSKGDRLPSMKAKIWRQKDPIVKKPSKQAALSAHDDDDRSNDIIIMF